MSGPECFVPHRGTSIWDVDFGVLLLWKFLHYYYYTCSKYMIIITWDGWYVTVVSIIFDCSMPIFFNFHILLATFYTIFGTNILLQCRVPVPICCMFYVSQNIHIKRNPKRDKNGRSLFLEYLENSGRKNPHETVPEVATRQGALSGKGELSGKGQFSGKGRHQWSSGSWDRNRRS